MITRDTRPSDTHGLKKADVDDNNDNDTRRTFATVILLAARISDILNIRDAYYLI